MRKEGLPLEEGIRLSSAFAGRNGDVPFQLQLLTGKLSLRKYNNCG